MPWIVTASVDKSGSSQGSVTLTGEAYNDEASESIVSSTWTEGETQGTVIVSPESPTTEVTGIVPGLTYQFNFYAIGSSTSEGGASVTFTADDAPAAVPPMPAQFLAGD
jgi:predicted secreted protein